MAEVKKRQAASSKPLGEYGPNGQLYQMGTGNMPGSYGSADLLQNPPQTWGDLGKQALRTGALVGGATLGGMAGRAVGEAVPLLSKVWSPLMSSAGTAAGQFTGDVATGGDPLDAAVSAGQTGLLNLGVEGSLNLGARGTGKIGNISNESINAALNRGPAATARMVWRAPAKDAELQIAEQLRGQLRPENPRPGSVNLTSKVPARLRAETAIRQFDASNPAPSDQFGGPVRQPMPAVPRTTSYVGSTEPQPLYRSSSETISVPGGQPPITDYGQEFQGVGPPQQSNVDIVRKTQYGETPPGTVRKSITTPQAPLGRELKGVIDTAPIKQKLLSMVDNDSLETGVQSVNAYLIDKANSLPDTMSAAELDKFIRHHSNPISTSYGAEQVPLPTRVKQGFLRTARAVRNATLPEAKPDFAKASNQLNIMRRTAKQFLEKTGEVKAGAVEKFKGILNDQWLRKILTQYEDRTGNHILEEADDLAFKRDWTKEDRGHAGRLWWIAERFLAKPAARFTATVARPAGHTAAAIAAFERSMENP